MNKEEYEMSRKLTCKNVIEFARDLQKAYDFKIITERPEDHKWLMRIANFLSRGKAKGWLSRWSITFPGHVWLSEPPGNIHVDTVYQIARMAHETKHIKQWRRDRIWFLFKYFLSKRFRAQLEREALQTTMEIYHAFGREIRVSALTDKLRSYRLSSSDIQTVYTALTSYKYHVDKGKRACSVAKWVCKWWGV